MSVFNPTCPQLTLPATRGLFYWSPRLGIRMKLQCSMQPARGIFLTIFEGLFALGSSQGEDFFSGEKDVSIKVKDCVLALSVA